MDRQELRRLMGEKPDPGVSIYLPTSRAGSETRQAQVHLKNLLKLAESELAALDASRATILEILGPARRLLDDDDFFEHQEDGLALLLAAGFERRIRLPVPVEEMVLAGRRFHLKPLLALMTDNGRFHVLAISQNRVQLFEAERHDIREMPLGEIPSSLVQALGAEHAEASLQYHTSAPRSGDRAAQITFHGQGGRENVKKEEITRFCRAIDEGLRSQLSARPAPLVLAAVDYLQPIYREVSRYPDVVAQGIDGNPELLDPRELLRRAWSAVEPRFRTARLDTARRFEERAGTGLAVSDPEEVVAAAGHGRIEALFAALDEPLWGRMPPGSGPVEIHPARRPGDEDLVDRAAAETLLHGGEVFAVSRAEMPAPSCLAATFRF